mmetsp:Transcript_21065/g.37501  ORF Transcript_21065/g.37501 Transcript_21065/m.37501 type:complete len:193 (+) Transcript_21065:31-609(+)
MVSDDFKRSLKASATGMKVKSAALETQMEILDKLQGPEDFFKFLQASGLSQDEIQRSLADPSQAELLLERTLEKKLAIDKAADAELKKNLKKIDRLHDIVVKNKPLDKSERKVREEQKEKKLKPKPVVDPSLQVPTYRLRIGPSKIVVVVNCELKGMDGVTLDVSETKLLLSLPGHVTLNISIPEKIDTDGY